MSKGLRRRLTFEDALDIPVQDFSHVHIYGKAATNFRNSFYYTPVTEEVVDEDIDAKNQVVLGQMRAAAAVLEKTAQDHRAQAHRVFQGAMPEYNGVHTQTAAPAAPAAPAPAAPAPAAPAAARPSMLQTSFASRMKTRQDDWKLRGWSSEYRQGVNRLRQEARMKADRAAVLTAKRRAPQEYNIASPPDSPPPSPRGAPDKLQAKYDTRLLSMKKKQNMTVQRPEVTSSSRDVLGEKRKSAAQIAKKRPLPGGDRSTLRKRKKIEGGDRGRRRVNLSPSRQ